MTKKLHKKTLWERYSLESLQWGETDPKGRVLIGEPGLVDYSKLLFCGCSIDTVRQLFSGTLKADKIEEIETAIEHKTFEVHYPAYGRFHVAKMGKLSGYRYKLQNNDEGIVILLGSYYTELDKPDSHLKIELSPHFIRQRGVNPIQSRLDLFANFFLGEWTHAGVAVHLALDVQGWTPPEDFSERFVTYSRTKRSYDGMASLEFDDLSTAVVRFGKKETESYLYGKANALQMAVYDKSKEIKVSDKVDDFHQYWASYTFGEFDPEQPVWRVEMRFHHRVVREIGEGMDEKLESFKAVAQHLTDMWRYALYRHRLDFDKAYLDPAWQIFLEDAEFLHEANELWIRRKKKTDITAAGKNFAAIIGNLISVCARHNQTVSHVMRQLKRLDCYDQILSYYRSRNLTESDLREQVQKGLCLRRLIGKAA